MPPAALAAALVVDDEPAEPVATSDAAAAAPEAAAAALSGGATTAQADPVAGDAALTDAVAYPEEPLAAPDDGADRPGRPPTQDAAWDPVVAGRDVRGVAGVSPIFGFLLSEAGLGTVGDLAEATPAAVRAALSVPGVVPVDDATAAAWIASARQLVGLE